MHDSDINFELPTIDIDKIQQKYSLTDEEINIIHGIMYNPFRGVGVLRATRPTNNGIHSWVWRQMMMRVSPEEKFHSAATVLDGYLSEYTYDDPGIEDFLHQLIDKIMFCVPTELQHGLNNWKNSLGS